MNKGRIVAGLDLGHVNTKAILMKGQEILGYRLCPTGLDVVAAAQTALHDALGALNISQRELAGIVATGIFREMLKGPPLNVTKTVPEYVADARGGVFLNKNSRTVIDIGGNIHKAIRYDANGDLLDVIQNDKCADGLGIFYTTMAKAMGMSEQEMSERALQSTTDLSIAVQCGLSAGSEAIDLISRGKDIADVAGAVCRFAGERVAAMCTTISLEREIVVAGGLAKSKALMKHLASYLKEDIKFVELPEYVGAIGAVMSYREP